MVESDTHKKQLISIALSGGENANAFQQDINLGEDMIFGQDTSNFRSRILRRLRAIFVIFETQKLFRLMTETIEWKREAEELILAFSYVDLETNKPEDFTKGFLLRA